MLHLVRFGALATVGWFASADGARYPRGRRVVARTPRGLEIAEVLAPPEGDLDAGAADGLILRGLTVEDQLLESRLLQNRDTAYDACQRRLAELGSPAVLMDVEHLFDGQTLVFYFLGDVPADVTRLTDELAESYDAVVQFRSFAEAVTAGCGPDCGSSEAAGGGCSSCSSGCAVADACATRRR